MVDPLGGPLYLDSSGLVKLYLPEAGSAELNAMLAGRGDLLVSELAVTEVVSALSRKRREGLLPAAVPGAVQREMLRHIRAGHVQTIDLLPEQHRAAEELLLRSPVMLRGMDALHLALALAGRARSMVSYDNRLRQAARLAGLALFPAAI